MTAFPAQRLGLVDRGLVRPGMKADLVVFDPARVRDLATFEKPHQYAEGISHVITNGQVVFENGAMTPARPGAVLYGGGHTRSSWRDFRVGERYDDVDPHLPALSASRSTRAPRSVRTAVGEQPEVRRGPPPEPNLELVRESSGPAMRGRVRAGEVAPRRRRGCEFTWRSTSRHPMQELQMLRMRDRRGQTVFTSASGRRVRLRSSSATGPRPVDRDPGQRRRPGRPEDACRQRPGRGRRHDRCRRRCGRLVAITRRPRSSTGSAAGEVTEYSPRSVTLPGGSMFMSSVSRARRYGVVRCRIPRRSRSQ